MANHYEGNGRRDQTAVFSVSTAEMASQIMMESDAASRSGRFGLVAPNRFAVRLHPRDWAVRSDLRAIGRELERQVEDESMERGRRMEGPVRVWFEKHPPAERGKVEIRATERKGRRPAWACLFLGTKALEITHNQAVVGRAGHADVIIDHDSLSPDHALIWWEAGQVRVRDLGSTYGTLVGHETAARSQPIPIGTPIRFGKVEAQLRLEG
ncbi:MAG: DUF3662 domain-containing protein [bacterium]|nr:DUF3662 domain-containing protein [bacterium]MYD04739.1 DUF2662 domain-containing protein [Acidimicrobiia bacterium]MYH56114.1 DUF2662 domain-containing protein [Acidimicrobiia bacterium]